MSDAAQFALAFFGSIALIIFAIGYVIRSFPNKEG